MAFPKEGSSVECSLQNLIPFDLDVVFSPLTLCPSWVRVKRFSNYPVNVLNIEKCDSLAVSERPCSTDGKLMPLM